MSSVPVPVVPRRLLVLLAATCLSAACSTGAPPPPPTMAGAGASAPAGAHDPPMLTRTVFDPPEAGLAIETITVGPRRHTTVRTIAGVMIEYRIEGAHWYIRNGIGGTGLPIDRWVHIDLDELRAAGAEVPAWMREPTDDAGFVFDLRVGDVHADETVTGVDHDRSDAMVTVVFASGLRAHGRRVALPADTIIELPAERDVIKLGDPDLPTALGS